MAAGRVLPLATHMLPMSVLTNTHVRSVPTEYRITVMETPEDEHYYGRTYDCYPNEDGTVAIHRGLDREYVPFVGMYLVEELDNGRPNGLFWLLTPEEFKEQYAELGKPGMEYGVRSVGGALVNQLNDVETARAHVEVVMEKMPLAKLEVVSRPAGSNDEWIVVGR